MADGAEAAALHERERFEKIQSSDVVPDGLHRTALVAERFEIGIIACEEWIRRRETHIATPGEFDPVLVIRTVAQTDDHLLAERMRLVQTEGRRRFVFAVEH